MSSLQSLEFANNHLTGFFDEMQLSKQDVNLPNLAFLSLNGNNLQRIPPIIKYLTNLRQLHLHMNKLGSIREVCRKQMKVLEVLDVGGNKIQEVPIALVHYLTNINLLNLSNNDINNVPYLLGFHKTLKTLQLDGNPMKSIRR